jgi:hypothetical protein
VSSALPILGQTRRPLLWSLVSLVALLTVLGLAPVASAQSAPAMVRVAHLSPDAPAVDVYLGGNKALSNVPFGAVSDYLSVPAGTYPIKVLPAGAPAADRGVIEASATVEGGKAYTVAAAGRLAQIGASIFADDRTAPRAGKAKIRVIHASPDAPAVDIAVKGGPVLFSNLAFKAASAYAEVDPGTYDLEVRPAGTTTVALALPGVRLDANTAYSAIANGLLQGQPALSVKAVVDMRGGGAGMPRTGAGGMAANETSPLALSLLVVGLGAALMTALVLRRRARRA